MKEGWKMVKLKDICNKASSNVAQKDLGNNNGNYPIFGASGFIKNVDFFHYDKPYIGIVKDGSGVGRVTLYPAYSSLLGTLQYILPKEGFSLSFVYYALQSLDLSKYKIGAAIPHIYFRDYGEKELSVPPLEEQHRIVSILDATFEKIDKLKANAEENLKNAKALFQQVLAQELKPKEGWVEKKLGEVVESITDGDHQPPPKSNKGIPFITISSINKEQRSVEWNNTFFVPKEYFDGLKEDRKPKRGDILYTVTGSYGIPVLIDFDIDFCFQRHIAIIRPNPETAYSEFVNYWLLSKYAMLQAEDTATGAAQKTVSLKSLRNFSFDYPLETSEQQRIVQTLDALSEKCRRLETIAQQTIRECDALKQSILRQAFSGEL